MYIVKRYYHVVLLYVCVHTCARVHAMYHELHVHPTCVCILKKSNYTHDVLVNVSLIFKIPYYIKYMHILSILLYIVHTCNVVSV